METDAKKPSDVFPEAVKKLEMSVLASQLTFVKVLAEGFDFLAEDCCNGLEVIADLCELRAGDLKRLGMEDEAELLIHLKENLLCTPQDNHCEGPSQDDGTDEIDVLYRIEFVRIMMTRLIGSLERQVNGGFKRRLRAA